MVDWSGLANLKYDILGQQANAASQVAATGAAAQRAQMPVQSAAAAQALADAELRRKQGENIGQETTERKDLFERWGTAQQVGQGLGLLAPRPPGSTRGGGLAGAEDMSHLARLSPGLYASDDYRLKRPAALGAPMPLKKGIARVPGKGKADTVPAMLAPGEAVLNQPAADGMGRGLIAMLNQMGQQKMGMV